MSRNVWPDEHPGVGFGGRSLNFPWLESICVLVALSAGWVVAQSDFGLALQLMLALVGLVIGGYILHRPFHQGFALYMALMAFNYYYFYCARLTGRNPSDFGDWGIPATPLEKLQKDIFFFVLLALALIKLFKDKMEGHPFWSRRLEHPLFKLILLYGAYVVTHGIFWILEGENTFNILQYIRTSIEFAAIPLVMCTALIRSEKQIDTVFKGIFYSLPVVSILGVIEFFIKGSAYERSYFGGELFYRAVSTLQNPNNLGAYLGTVLGIYILYFLYGRLNRFERWWFWPSLILGVACLFMTISRSSILIFFLMITLTLGVYFLAAWKSRKKLNSGALWKLVLGYGLLVGGSGLVLLKYFDFSHAMVNAVDLYVDNRAVLSQNRLYAPIISMAALLESPMTALFGYTPSGYIGSDNSIANVLVQNGVIGFLLYIAIWQRAWMDSLFGAIRGQAGRAHLYMASFYLIGFQVMHGFTSPINKNFPHNMYFWFTVGVLIWLGSRPAQSTPREETPDADPQAAPALDAVADTP
jgi:hypothetical protein